MTIQERLRDIAANYPTFAEACSGGADEIDRLQKALVFYANRFSYRHPRPLGTSSSDVNPHTYIPPVMMDYGRRAREALAVDDQNAADAEVGRLVAVLLEIARLPDVSCDEAPSIVRRALMHPDAPNK